jgi:hypothetical protein
LKALASELIGSEPVGGEPIGGELTGDVLIGNEPTADGPTGKKTWRHHPSYRRLCRAAAATSFLPDPFSRIRFNAATINRNSAKSTDAAVSEAKSKSEIFSRKLKRKNPLAFILL